MIKQNKSGMFSDIAGGKSTLQILYKDYKDYIASLLIIFICILLFLFIIIPQIQDLMALRAEEKNTRERINLLRKNLNYLSKIDSAELDTKFQTGIAVLPIQKDYTGILNSVAMASSISGVSLGDYSFQVGDLDENSKIFSPGITLSLKLNANLEGTKRFLKEISKSVPVSEVTGLKSSDKSTDLTVVFYFMPQPPLKLSEDLDIRPVSAKNEATLREITSWKKTSVISDSF